MVKYTNRKEQNEKHQGHCGSLVYIMYCMTSCLEFLPVWRPEQLNAPILLGYNNYQLPNHGLVKGQS